MSPTKSYFRVVHDDIPLEELGVDELQLLIDYFTTQRSHYQDLIRVLNQKYPQVANCIIHRLHVIEHELNNLCLILKYRKHYEYRTEDYMFR